jgi:hypothetical protein
MSFIFIFVLKFLCLVCRLGGAGVGAGNLALKAPVLQAEALIPCVGFGSTKPYKTQKNLI